jgi:hypothetical protein
MHRAWGDTLFGPDSGDCGNLRQACMHVRPNTRRHPTHHCGPRASVGWPTENSSEHTTPHPSAVMHCKIFSIPFVSKLTTRQFQATANGTSISSDHFSSRQTGAKGIVSEECTLGPAFASCRLCNHTSPVP